MAGTPAAENRLEAGKVIAFARNIEHVGQQRKSRLMHHVDADTAFSEPGDRFTSEEMGLSDPVDMVGDITPTPGGVVSQKRRVAFFKGYNDGKFVGTRDAAEKLVNPKNGTVIAMGAGKERRRDRDIFGKPGGQGGLFGSSWEIDQDGDMSVVALPAAQIIPVGFNGHWKGQADSDAQPGAGFVGLGPQKLRRAKVILDKSEHAEMSDDLPIIALEEEDLQNFATSIEMMSKEFSVHDIAKAEKLANGDIDVFKGYRFVKVSNGRLPLVPGQTDRWYAPVWFKSAIQYKERPLVGTRIQERADMSYRWHAYYESQASTLRRDDKAVTLIEISRP